MVFMEIIDLDNTQNSRNSRMARKSTRSKSPITRSKKRKLMLLKRLSESNKQLFKRKKSLNDENTILISDPDATLPPTSSTESNDHNSPLLRDKIKRRKKRKKSSVVIIDSEDDEVLVEKVVFNNNNSNANGDVLSLSDNSVIELSDDDIGVVAGCVETTQECAINKKRVKNNENMNRACGIVDITAINKHKDLSFFEFNERNNINKVCGDHGASIETVTAQNLLQNKELRVPSRQSISYQPYNIILPVEGKPRPIVIDGSNVAFGHGKERFSALGIDICVDYFHRRKHPEIRVFVPQFRRRHPSTVGIHILDKLEKEGHLVYTPSRQVEGRRVTSYDDRFIVEYAAKTGGIVVTRDNYQDLLAENKAWSDTINFRLLQYTFVGDMIMFPQDPLGRGGPNLDKFLLF